MIVDKETQPAAKFEYVSLLKSAFEAGAQAVFEDWRCAHYSGVKPPDQPDFSDAARSYAADVVGLTPAPQPAGEAVSVAQVTVAEAALFEARKELQTIKEMVMRGNQRNTIMDKCESEQVKLDAALRALKGGDE